MDEMSEDSEYGAEEYLCYEVVRQAESRGAELSETAFNKFCALVHDEVQGEVELPLRWYQYGYEVDRQFLSDDFLRFTSHSRGGGSATQVTLEGEASRSLFDVPEELMETIRGKVRLYADQFQQHQFVSSYIKNESYERQAPNEFVQLMNDFRDELEEMDATGVSDRDEHVSGVDTSFNKLADVKSAFSPGTESGDTDVNDERLRSLLRELGGAFPEETYEKMAPLFYEWKMVSEKMIRYELYSELREFQKEFWNTFSKVELRIHHERNIPYSKRVKWEKHRPKAIEKFEEVLAAKRDVIQEYREPTDQLSEVSEGFDEAVENVMNNLE